MYIFNEAKFWVSDEIKFGISEQILAKFLGFGTNFGEIFVQLDLDVTLVDSGLAFLFVVEINRLAFSSGDHDVDGKNLTSENYANFQKHFAKMIEIGDILTILNKFL